EEYMDMVEFWRCRCDKPYRSEHAVFQQLAPFLPSEFACNAPIILLCNACKLICSYDALPDPFLKGSLDPHISVEKIFRARIFCADPTCESRITVHIPTTSYWTKG